MTGPLVLDTWAILAFWQDEPAGEQVEDLLAASHKNGEALWMSVVNAGEVWYILARETSIGDADQGILELQRLGIRFVDAGWNQAKAAAEIKAAHPISYADAFAAALAKEKGALLVTGDGEFKQVEQEIQIHWLKQ
jgi:predicted nucleic acid-binding protein